MSEPAPASASVNIATIIIEHTADLAPTPILPHIAHDPIQLNDVIDAMFDVLPIGASGCTIL